LTTSVHIIFFTNSAAIIAIRLEIQCFFLVNCGAHFYKLIWEIRLCVFIVFLHLLLYFCTTLPISCMGRVISYHADESQQCISSHAAAKSA